MSDDHQPQLTADIPSVLNTEAPVIRRLTRTTPAPGAEDLSPTAPDPLAVPGEVLPHPDVVEVTHDASPPRPEAVAGFRGIAYRLDVVLPVGDPRVASMDLLYQRAIDVLSGELLSPPEASAVLHRPKMVSRRDADAAPHASPGRPHRNRRGTLTAPDGVTQTGFFSMSELAAQLGSPYSAVVTKYLSVCRASGLDPDDHDGVQYTYKGHTVHVLVR